MEDEEEEEEGRGEGVEGGGEEDDSDDSGDDDIVVTINQEKIEVMRLFLRELDVTSKCALKYFIHRPTTPRPSKQ